MTELENSQESFGKRCWIFIEMTLVDKNILHYLAFSFLTKVIQEKQLSHDNIVLQPFKTLIFNFFSVPANIVFLPYLCCSKEKN